MKRLLTIMIGAACAALGANAATLPSWVPGTYKGTVVNWCDVDDDPSDIGPWYGTANLTVAQNGKISGEMLFSDGKCTLLNEFSVQSIGDSEVHIVAKYKWYDLEDPISYGYADIYIRKSSAGVVTLTYTDADRQDGFDEYCPIEGTLAKTDSAVAIPDAWKKARTFTAALVDGDEVLGVLTVKAGRANARTRVASISGSVTGLDGRKVTAKAVRATLADGAATVDLVFKKNGKNGTTATVTVDAAGISGEWNGAEISTATVGGEVGMNGAATFVVQGFAFEPSGGLDVLEEYLPLADGWRGGEPVAVNARTLKWTTARAATLRFRRVAGDAVPTCGEAVCEDAGGNLYTMACPEEVANPSALRLNYNPKTGVFKGSFRIYASQCTARTPKLKKYTATVTGLVVGGRGYGQASVKRPAAGPWTVTVE